jgi:hypothetical protein
MENNNLDWILGDSDSLDEESNEYKIPKRTFDPTVNSFHLYGWLREFLDANGKKELELICYRSLRNFLRFMKNCP